MMKHNDNRLLLWIIPLFIMGWGIFSLLFFDTFYSRAVDPEYPYLINGLNVSMLKFKMIGHFDHPGTPFQIFCGIIIRITHLLTGKGSLAQDVFNRPDYYLSAISLSLTVLQSALTLIVGTTGRQSKLKTSQLILLQAGILFNFLMLELFFRVIPERWLVVTALLFVICYLRYGYKDSRPMKFALWSGVVMGMGMATKFNFLPVLFLPFLLMPTAKTRLIYAGTTLLSFFVFIAPILSKFKEFYRFISAIATHDGIYGQGKEQMFNFAVMKENIGHVIHTAPELSILLMLIVAAVIIGFVYRKRGQLTHSPFLFAGIILIIALQLLMVSKHYKNTYLVPLFSFYSLFLFLSDDFFSKLFRQSERYIFIATLSTCIFFVGITLKRTIDVMPDLSNQKAKREELRQYVSQNLSDSTLWFTEPSWESAPYVENGIVYGISYCGRRTFYREELF
ncbi:MAG: hypothetical protein LBQ64_00910, partial [Bacteroidales bacterium]|nr:hypothetical protein [Bacteroidales bacterium]